MAKKKQEETQGKEEKKKEEKFPTIKVAACSCASDFQDARYGPGRRVHNRTGRTTPHGYRCTVCGRG